MRAAHQLGLVFIACLATRIVSAQYRPTSYWALRGDAIVARGATEHLGAGVELPLDAYTREGIYVEGGATERDGSVVPSARVDLFTRFLLDPYRQARWGFSLGGGLTVPMNESRHPTRPNVAVIMDLEGPSTGRFSPAIQLGLGGGARLGVILRANRRSDQR